MGKRTSEPFLFMTFVTYTKTSRFTPDVLGVTASSAFFVLLFEVLFIKLGMYLLSVNSSMTLLDSLAYCGYKFVPLIGTRLLKFGAGGTIVYSFFAYAMIAYGFFTVSYFSSF